MIRSVATRSVAESDRSAAAIIEYTSRVKTPTFFTPQSLKMLSRVKTPAFFTPFCYFGIFSDRMAAKMHKLCYFSDKFCLSLGAGSAFFLQQISAVSCKMQMAVMPRKKELLFRAAAL